MGLLWITTDEADIATVGWTWTPVGQKTQQVIDVHVAVAVEVIWAVRIAIDLLKIVSTATGISRAVR